jgi:Flp pilus assembly protein TadD
MHYKDEANFYKYVLSLDKHNVIALVNLGNVYADKKMYAQAMEQARLALKEEPLSWDARFLMGNIYQAKGDLARAAQMYNDSLALNPGSYEAYNNLGLIYQKQGNIVEAIRHFRKSAELNPEGLGVLHNLADILIRNGSYQDAAVLIKHKILQISPQDAGAYNKLGVALAEAGDYKGAEDAFLGALRIDPGSSNTIKDLAALYANTGAIDKAISMWEQVLSMDPRNEGARRDIDTAKRMKLQGHEDR